jgi:type IV pilus assembly PilX-like protein
MKKQRGAVLLVSLIFLLLITAIAASLMTSGSFETVMIGNVQQKENVFRTAESAVEQAAHQDIVFSEARKRTVPYEVPSGDLAELNENLEYKVEVEYLSAAGRLPPAGFGIGEFQYQMYEIRGEANTSDERIGTEVIQGVGALGRVGSLSD